jgi:outer membrane protein assembly factor BamD
LYINTHPNSAHIEECNMLIDEMRAKLEKKSFEIAKQYWRTEHYKAAVTALNSSMNDFPDTPYREQAMYLKLDSSYKLAKNSIVSLQFQRFRQARTAYYDLVEAFPESEYRKQADRIFEEIQQSMNELTNSNENTSNS